MSSPHLFDMKEVFSLKSNSMSWDRNIVIVGRGVGVVCAYSKCNRFRLPIRNRQLNLLVLGKQKCK